MAILHSCCFWKSVRKGSYASAIYALIYFGSSCIIVSIFLHDERQYLSGEVDQPSGESFLEREAISPATVIFNILLLICASCGVLSSVLVIIGLRRDQRIFLIPWIFIMTTDLIIECSHFSYLVVIETLEFEPLTATLFTVDFFIMCLNVYCLLCVISQYQEYKVGRGYAGHESRSNRVRITPPAPTTTCLHTFRQSHALTRPLMRPNSNFTIIPEETQLNGGLAVVHTKPSPQNIPTKRHHLGILKKKRVQFPDDEDSKYGTDSPTRILTETNGTGRMLIDTTLPVKAVLTTVAKMESTIF